MLTSSYLIQLFNSCNPLHHLFRNLNDCDWTATKLARDHPLYCLRYKADYLWYLVCTTYFFHFSLLLTFLFNKQHVLLKAEQLLKTIICIIIYSYSNIFLLYYGKNRPFICIVCLWYAYASFTGWIFVNRTVKIRSNLDVFVINLLILKLLPACLV